MASTSDQDKNRGGSSDEDNDCPICCCEMEPPFELPCKHRCCQMCSKHWLLQAGTCPICRRETDLKCLDEPQQINLKMGMKKAKKRAYEDKAELKDDDLEDVKPDLEELKAKMAKNDMKMISTTNAKRFWLYETYTKGAWWRFSLRDEQLLEDAFQAKRNQTELDILGKKYTIGFPEMAQWQKDYPEKERAIKRVEEDDFDNLKVIGIAGVPCKEVWTVE